jgi:adenylate cyclase
MWQLIINGPGYFNTSYELPEGETSLGRADDNDIVLSGDLVSRKHAIISVKGEGLGFRDLGSRNGSRVNGEPVKTENALNEGDTVTVGENSLSILRQQQKLGASGTESNIIRHYGSGVDISQAVLVAREVRDSYVMRALDNVPFDPDGNLGEPPSTESYDQLVFLYRTAEHLAKADTLSEFLEKTVNELLPRVKATTAVVLLKNPEGPMLPAIVRHSEKLPEGEVPVSDAIIEEAMTQGTAIAVADVQSDHRFSQRDSVIVYGADQVLCVPLGKAPHSGVLYLNRRGDQNEGELAELLELCTGVGNFIVTALQKFSTPQKVAPEDRLGRALGRHFAPTVATKRAAELKRLKKADSTFLEQRLVTTVFADLAGFTGLTQQLPPEEVGKILTEFYTQMAGIVFSFDGTLDKFTGDGVMAIFGYPTLRSDDALRAVRAAVAMRSAWAKVKRAHKLPVEYKAGICTGPVTVGTVALGERLELSTVGRSVNYAAWLTGWALPGQVLITDSTLGALGGSFEVTPQGDRTVKEGKDKVSVFEVVQEDFARLTKPGGR